MKRRSFPGSLPWVLLALGAALLTPYWAGGLVANGGFLAFLRHDWRGAETAWAMVAGWPGPLGERQRLASVAALRAGDPAAAVQRALAAAAPGRSLEAALAAPTPGSGRRAAPAWLQLGAALAEQGAQAQAQAAWRQVGAARYFCTQAARALYNTTPPDLAGAAAAAATCTLLDPGAGDGWLILGQARAAQHAAAGTQAALERAYTTLLAGGQAGRAAVAAATGAAVTTDPAQAATWTSRGRALAPTVCADPARPRDPHLDGLCADFGF